MTSCAMSQISVHSSSGTLSDLIPWNYLSHPLYNCKGFDLGHTWMVSGFPYFLQFKSEFGNKEFMIWKEWRRKWQPIQVLLPGKSHGQRSLVGYSPWGRKESDTSELLAPSSWSEPQSAPGLVFADCIELLPLWLQRIQWIWVQYWPSGDVHV